MTHFDVQKESDLKSSIANYLQILENQGSLWYERLNSGELLVLNKDGSKRMVNLCRKGTADFITIVRSHVIFIETKSKTGKQSPEQKEFQSKVESVGALYWLVDDFDKFLTKISVVLNF
jgi:hypothetical protein